MTKAIIFDCFGVLYVDASRYFYEHTIANYGALEPELAALNRAYDMGVLSQDQLNQQVAELAQLPLDFVASHIGGIHKRNQLLLDYAQSLRTQYKVGMLSNIGVGGMETYFSQAERDELFDGVVLSSDVRMVKPDPEIFRYMARQLGVPCEGCIMIDDIAVNVAGAVAAGMQGIVYRTNGQTMDDLAALLGHSHH